MSDRVAVLFLATLVGCWSAAGRAGELPDRKLTPGTVNAAISEEQYHAQCHAKGWTRLYRPPVSFANFGQSACRGNGAAEHPGFS